MPLKLGSTTLPKSASVNYVKNGETLPVSKIDYDPEQETVWEFEGLKLNIRVRSIDYNDYNESTRYHVWTRTNVAKFISNIKVWIKDIASGTATLAVNKSGFSGNTVDMLDSNELTNIKPGRHSINVSVKCKDWCCVDEIRINRKTDPASATDGQQLIVRNRTYGSDDATQTTTTGYKTVSASTFTTGGTAYIWITLSAFHFYEEVDMNKSTASLLDDRYSDYYSISTHIYMKSGISTDRTKIKRMISVYQYNRGTRNREFDNEDSDGQYYTFDSASQDSYSPFLDASSSNPMIYTLLCAPKENFVNWQAPNVISIGGAFTGTSVSTKSLGQYN